MRRGYHEGAAARYAGWRQRRRRIASVVPGGGTRGRTLSPNSPARRSSNDDARSASAAIVSEGLTQREVGTDEASVTKRPEWPRSSCRSSSAEVAGSSPHAAGG